MLFVLLLCFVFVVVVVVFVVVVVCCRCCYIFSIVSCRISAVVFIVMNSWGRIGRKVDAHFV